LPGSEAGDIIPPEASSMKIRPLHDRIVVKRIEEEEVKAGGIFIPDTAKEKPMQGEVIAVGEGKLTERGERVPLHIRQGDRVLFGKYSGSEIKIEGQDLLIMREDDVLGILGELPGDGDIISR
jgi:chaperonin GroES